MNHKNCEKISENYVRVRTLVTYVKMITSAIVMLLLVACDKPPNSNFDINSTTSKKRTHSISGAAQKGPFVKGTQVLINRLSPTGESTYDTSVTFIQDDLGYFSFSSETTGAVIVEADGINFNEVTGQLSRSRLQLRAIFNVTAAPEQHSHVNVLTHLAYKYALKLIRQGLSVDDAIKLSQSAVLSSLKGIFPNIEYVDFAQLDLFGRDENNRYGNALLLSFSATLSQWVLEMQASQIGSTFDTLLQDTINRLSDEIAENGSIDHNTIDALKVSSKNLDPDRIRKFLESRDFDDNSIVLPVAELNLFIDTDGDDVVNSSDDDDDNDGIEDSKDKRPYIYSEIPVLFSPTDTRSLPTLKDIQFDWSVSEYATSVETQISTLADFSNNEKLVKLEGRSITTRFNLVETYYIRARARNKNGSLGPWSDVRAMMAGIFFTEIHVENEPHYSSLKPTHDDGSLIYSFDAYNDSVTKVDSQGNVSWTYFFGPNFQLAAATTEMIDGTLIFRGQDQSQLGISNNGKFLWGKSAHNENHNKWRLTNPVLFEDKLYSIYVGQQCSGPLQFISCEPQLPTPTLLKIDPLTGETDSIPLPLLNNYSQKVPVMYDSYLGINTDPPIKPFLNVFNSTPGASQEPAWSNLYSLMISERKQLVLAFSSNWFRHDCPNACNNFGLMGLRPDGMVDWVWLDDAMMSSDIRESYTFPDNGTLFLPRSVGPEKYLVNEDSIGLRKSDLPPQTLGTNTNSSNIYISTIQTESSLVATLVNPSDNTFKRAKLPCAYGIYTCEIIDYSFSAAGGLTILYRAYDTAKKTWQTLISKHGVENGP